MAEGAQKGEKRCVYTVVMGGYEELLDQHVAALFGSVDLICFTDDPGTTSKYWDMRVVERVLPDDPNRSSRRPKMLAHEYLADYDASLYVDNSVLLTVDPNLLFDRYLPAGIKMSAFVHSYRDSIRQEFAIVVAEGKEAGWVAAEQLAHYETIDPEMLELPPIWGGFLLRRHNDPQVVAAMRTWWDNLLRYSRRDQLSLRLAVRSAGLEVPLITLDNFISEIHEWPRYTRRDPSRSAPLPIGPAKEIDDLRAQVDLEHRAAQDQATASQRQKAEFDVEKGRLALELEQVQGRISEMAARISEIALATELTAREQEQVAREQERVAGERDQIAAEYAAIKDTRSWRLTQPMRSIAAWFKRLLDEADEVPRN